MEKVNRNITQKLRNKNKKKLYEKLNEIKSIINEKITRTALDTSTKVGALLNKLPIKKHGFSLDSLSGIAYTSDIIFH